MLGNFSLVNELKTFDVTYIQPEMARKAKRAIDELKKDLKLEDSAEMIAVLRKKSSAASGLF